MIAGEDTTVVILFPAYYELMDLKQEISDHSDARTAIQDAASRNRNICFEDYDITLIRELQFIFRALRRKSHDAETAAHPVMDPAAVSLLYNYSL